jgi:hypothetical protein
VFDDINITEENDIKDILENINWELIPLGRIFEFIIKFPDIICHSKIESKIITALYKKFNVKFLNIKKEENVIFDCVGEKKFNKFNKVRKFILFLFILYL